MLTEGLWVACAVAVAVALVSVPPAGVPVPEALLTTVPGVEVGLGDGVAGREEPGLADIELAVGVGVTRGVERLGGDVVVADARAADRDVADVLERVAVADRGADRAVRVARVIVLTRVRAGLWVAWRSPWRSSWSSVPPAGVPVPVALFVTLPASMSVWVTVWLAVYSHVSPTSILPLVLVSPEAYRGLVALSSLTDGLLIVTLPSLVSA